MKEDFDKDDLLGRWLGGSLSPEEEAALRKRPDFAAYEELVRSVDELSAPDFDQSASLAKLKAKRKKRGADAGARPSQKAKVRRLRPAHWAGIAASILLLISLWFFWPEGTHNYVAAAAATEQASLPDGSTIRLNAVSEIDFETTPEQRMATLAGEAYFDVAKENRPFTISTPLGQVTVLGTTFNIYSRGKEMRVTCSTGKVRVSFTQSDSLYTLTQGMSVSLLTDGTVSHKTITDEEALDWLSGRSVFNLRPLSEVIEELERQFNLNISLPDSIDPSKRIQTAFPHADATAALEILVTTLEGIAFEQNANNVRLYQKKTPPPQ